MKIPGIGELKTRIGIRAWNEVPNAQMGTDPEYGAPLLVWAKMMRVSGALFYGSQQIEKTVTHRFIIRTGPSVTARHVIEAKGSRFLVRSSDPMNAAPHFTVIDAEEIGKIA